MISVNAINHEPQGSMKELLEKMQNGRVLKNGDLVKGKVVLIYKDGILVEVGGKSEALVQRNEVPKGLEMSIGDEVTVLVLEAENEDGQLIGSLKGAKAEEEWLTLERAKDSGDVVSVVVKDQNKGGYTIAFGGIRGFLPQSQAGREAMEDPRALVGREIAVKVSEVNRRKGSLVASLRAAEEESKGEDRRRVLENLKVGQVVDGKVQAITTYGAFVSFPVNSKEDGSFVGTGDGLVHISELAWERVAAVKDVVSEKEDVKVQIIKLEPETGRISLSIRSLHSDPWKEVTEELQIGRVFEGEITRVKKYGLFVMIKPGVEGLLHSSEMQGVFEPLEEHFKEGEKIRVAISDIQEDQRRIILTVA